MQVVNLAVYTTILIRSYNPFYFRFQTFQMDNNEFNQRFEKELSNKKLIDIAEVVQCPVHHQSAKVTAVKDGFSIANACCDELTEAITNELRKHVKPSVQGIAMDMIKDALGGLKH
jgi:hypothetical protein